MTDPTPDLPAARLALDTAVQQLIQPGRIPIDRDTTDHPDVAEVEAEHQAADRRARDAHAAAVRRHDGPAKTRAMRRILLLEQQRQARTADRGWTPPLLDQLIDAVESSSGGGTVPAAGVHRAPIGLAAAELLAHIQRTTRARTVADLGEHLRAWARDAGHWQTDDPARLLVNAALAQQWAADAHNLLNPQRPLTLAEPCPHCQRSIVHVRDDTGEVVRRAALQIDRNDGSARCIGPGCGAVWTTEHLPLLASVLEEQAREREQRRAG